MLFSYPLGFQSNDSRPDTLQTYIQYVVIHWAYWCVLEVSAQQSKHSFV